MGKNLQELAGTLKEEALPTGGEELDDLPQYGSYGPPPAPGAYRFKMPADQSSIFDVFDVPDKRPPQRIKVIWDRDHPLLITQSPQGKYNGDPFETRMTNNERPRNRDKTIVASDVDYLLRACGEKTKPKSNRDYMQAVAKLGGREFGADLKYSWRCSKDRDIRVKDNQGTLQVIEGKKGCGEAFYQEDAPKNADGSIPYEIRCSGCGATLRAFPNLENLRA